MWHPKARSASLREFFASEFDVSGQRSLLPPTSSPCFVAIARVFSSNSLVVKTMEITAVIQCILTAAQPSSC